MTLENHLSSAKRLSRKYQGQILLHLIVPDFPRTDKKQGQLASTPPPLIRGHGLGPCHAYSIIACSTAYEPRVDFTSGIRLNLVHSSSIYIIVIEPLRRLAVVNYTCSCLHLYLRPDLRL